MLKIRQDMFMETPCRLLVLSFKFKLNLVNIIQGDWERMGNPTDWELPWKSSGLETEIYF